MSTIKPLDIPDLFAAPTPIELKERQQHLQDQVMDLFLRILGDLNPPFSTEEIITLCQNTVFYSNLDVNTGLFREKPFIELEPEIQNGPGGIVQMTKYAIINSLKEKISQLRPNVEWTRIGVLNSSGQLYWTIDV